MELVFKGLQWEPLLLNLFSSDFDSHVGQLEEVLQCFRSVRFKFKPSKRELFWVMLSAAGALPLTQIMFPQ